MARFIIRLWVEPLKNGHGSWRGQIESVPVNGPVRQRAHFEDGVGLLAFLRRCLQAKGGPHFPDSMKRPGQGHR